MINQRKHIDSQLNDMLFSKFEIEGNDFILNVFRSLLEGKPITKGRYYEIVNLPKDKADAILVKLGETDDQDNIVAFSGLSLIPTDHHFNVNGKKLYTWCAIDAILFAEWLDVEVYVLSTDPIDDTPIELQINGGQLQWTKPYPLFISWVESIDTCNIRDSLCNHVTFYGSEKTAQEWLNNNPQGKILTLEDFFTAENIGLKCC
ncbi:MAG: organomercurial lyase [Candidatus Marinimicrobia bacterium]|nr:organomercurial lyase [Candidatus Neomarinimicrobiota bacterium]